MCYNGSKLILVNPGKLQCMILGDKKNNTFVLNIHDNEIKNSSEVELLGITIDSQVTVTGLEPRTT